MASIRAAFADMGKQPPSREAARDVIGLSLTDAMARLWPGADDTQRSRVAERYRFYNHGADETPSILFPGARELVDWLLQRDYLLAVATGKSRRGLDPILGDTGLSDHFHATQFPPRPTGVRPLPLAIEDCSSSVYNHRDLTMMGQRIK